MALRIEPTGAPIGVFVWPLLAFPPVKKMGTWIYERIAADRTGPTAARARAK